jgi:1-phosphofructokinase family hexose kinase
VARALLIAGPNLTLDRTGSLDELRAGEVLRFEHVVATPGGKGLNVARAARALGAPGTLVSLVPGASGRVAAALIAEEGVAFEGVSCPGQLRSAAIVTEASGRTTVLNEPGPTLAPADWAAYEAAVAASLAGRGALVCSGSLPPGAPADAYARLAAEARRAGLPCVVDASGAALGAAVAAGVDVVTPNLGEAEALGGSGSGEAVEAAADARPRGLAAAGALVAAGVRAAVVTVAAAGAAVATPAEAIWLAAPPAEVRNPVGAGDVLTAALAVALARGAAIAEAAVEGVGAASASVETPRAGDVDPARARRLAALVDRAA